MKHNSILAVTNGGSTGTDALLTLFLNEGNKKTKM
jgi:hypothetical protein